MRTLSRYRALELDEIQEDFEGSWAVSYGDMITLLLSFFILFFNVNRVSVSMPSVLQDVVVQHLKKGLARSVAPVLNTESKGHLDQDLQIPLGAKVTTQASRTLIEFKNISFFRSGQVDLTRKGTDALRQFTKAFTPYAGKYRVIIKAFTDLAPVKRVGQVRAFRNNMELSALRAVTTARVLERLGIPLSQMVPAGFGEMLKDMNGTLTEKMSKQEKKLSKDQYENMRTVAIILEPIQ